MTDLDQLDALGPVLRLTGQQIGSIDPPPEGDWFADFDEYEEFVPKRVAVAAVRERDELRELARELLDAIDEGRPFTNKAARLRAGLHHGDGA